MKKVLIGVLVIIALVLVGAIVFMGKLDGLIADVIRTEGTAALGTAVTLESVETKLGDGVAIINGLAIANPPGYKAANAIRIDTFHANVDYKSQTIGDVVINRPVINAELVGTDSNFQSLLDGMPDAGAEADESANQEDELVLSIKSLKMLQATVNIDSDQIGQTSFMMDDLVLNNLSGTVDQLSDIVTNRLIEHISNQVKAFAVAQITEMVKEKAIEEAKEKINEKVQEKINRKLSDKLKGFKLKID